MKLEGNPTREYQRSHREAQSEEKKHTADNMKVDLKFKNPLPVTENHCNDYDEYINRTSNQANQIRGDPSIAQQKIQTHRVDPKSASFKVLSCHALVNVLSFTRFSLLIWIIAMWWPSCLI